MTDSAHERGPAPVYKVLTSEEARALEEAGCFDGNPDDLRDGFLHLAFGEQVRSVVNKRFAGHAGLVVAELGPDAVAAEVRVEAASSGRLYPHLYRSLRLADVQRAIPLDQFLQESV